jgi:hypothetical protein
VIAALARPSLARLLGTPRSLLAPGAWCVLALGFALAARWWGAVQGADHVLVDAYATLILPLLVYTLVGAVLGGRSLAAATAPLVVFGASPARAALATVAVAVAASVAAGAFVAALVAIVAHGSGDPPAARDALASAYAGALGGAAYAGWFALGASFGKRGGARTWLLIVDWVLGLGRGPVAIITPRAHLRSLLGGAAPMDWSGRASAVALVILAAVCVLGACRSTLRQT